jgi:hypothetical protein
MSLAAVFPPVCFAVSAVEVAVQLVGYVVGQHLYGHARRGITKSGPNVIGEPCIDRLSRAVDLNDNASLGHNAAAYVGPPR